MDFSGQGNQELDDHDGALGIISVMGQTFSISSLFLTLLFVVLVKELRQSLVHQALFHMALALLLSYVTFLAGIQRVADREGCVAVAMVLHYLILASFLWMLAQGVLYYVTIVKGRSPSAKRFICTAAVLAWGLPIIPLATVSAIDVELYRGGSHYCWMSLTLLYYAFLTPIAVVVVINLVIYVLVVVSICRGPRSARDNSNNLASSARVSFSCFCVMGLSWVFAFLAVEGAQLVFQYLFTISTTFTGVFIFVMYTARHPAVKVFGIQCANRIRGASATPPGLDPSPAVQLVPMRDMK